MRSRFGSHELFDRMTHSHDVQSIKQFEQEQAMQTTDASRVGTGRDQALGKRVRTKGERQDIQRTGRKMQGDARACNMKDLRASTFSKDLRASTSRLSRTRPDIYHTTNTTHDHNHDRERPSGNDDHDHNDHDYNAARRPQRNDDVTVHALCAAKRVESASSLPGVSRSGLVADNDKSERLFW